MPETCGARDARRLVALALGVLALAFALTWSRMDDASSWDVPLYQSFGDRIADGQLPYRDVRIEYPPGALPAFVLPALATRAVGRDGAPQYEPELNDAARSYAFWFALLMAVALGATIVATAASAVALGLTRRAAALGLLTIALTPVLLGELALTRFDALPVALTGIAAALLLRDHRLGSAIVLALAVSAKLYPLLLLPVAAGFVWHRGGRAAALRYLATTAAVVVATFLPFFLAAPSETWFSVRAQLSRGLQVESLGGSVVLALDGLAERIGLGSGLAGIEEGGTGSVRSADVVGHAGSIVGLLLGLLGLAGVVWIWRTALRGPLPGARLVWACATILTLQLALGRVLSPQFLMWLLPFVPLVAGRRGRAALAVLVAALLVTQVWFPDAYRDFVNGQAPGATLVLLARNALLLMLLAVLVLPGARYGSLRGRSPSTPPAASSRNAGASGTV